MDESTKNEGAKEETTTPGGTEHKTDNITVLVDQQPGCKIKLDVTIRPKASLAAYKKAIKTINKDVSLPGFRKGKAPEAMIIQNYGQYVDQEWREILVQTTFSETLDLVKIFPLNESSIQKPQMKKISREEDSNIVFEYESMPQVPDIDLKGLKIKSIARKDVTQEEIDDSLNNILYHHATWEEVTDRAVQDGDYVDVDIEDLDHPGRFICQDTRFEVDGKKMGEWMRKLVVGKNVQDVVEGMSERSPDLDPEKEFTPTQCKITIKAIKTATLPEVDEELAKKVGVSTVEELMDRLTKNLNSQADEEVRHKLQNQFDELLFEQYPFDIPTSLAKREMKNRLEVAKREMQKAGVQGEEIAKRQEELRGTLGEKIHRSFHMFFMARKVAEENNIEVSQDELLKELMMQMYSQSSPIDTSMDPEEARNKVYLSLLTQKVKDFFVDQATIE